jgi:diguanylate cyclase (GGDEF)-like protein
MRNMPVPLPAAQAAFDSGNPVVVSEAESSLMGTWGATTFEVQSLLAVPLGEPPRTLGVLVLDDPQPDRFSAEQVRLAAAAAEHLAPTIEQARASEERSSHLRAATAIRRLLEEGAGTTSVEEAGEVLARVTRDAIDCESATLLVRDERDRIEHVATVGGDGEFEQTLRDGLGDLPAQEFRLWRITARQNKPVFVENAGASRLLPPDLVAALPLKSYVALPLLSASRPLGLVLCSHSQSHRPWTSEERQLVAQLALEGSLIVENAALRAAEQQRLDELAHQAFHDSLTELPNRALFADRLTHALARTNRRQAAVAVLFLDLDDFKPINDNFGHDVGDQLLVALARRVQACVRPEDTVARLGGDEFTVLLEDIADVRYAIAVAERIEESLRAPFVVNGNELSVTASIGVAASTGRESTPDDLLRDSDSAMYLAKRKGRARHEVFRREPTEPAAADRGARPPVDEDAGEEISPAQEIVIQEMAAETSVEEPLIAEQTEEAALDRTDEAPAHAEQPDAQPPEEPADGAAALTEARRRRRRRFPPRR